MSISSLVVNVLPKNLGRVTADLNRLDGVEVQGSNPNGTLVVLVDHPDRRVCGQSIMDIQNIAGVINASLVYDYIE